MPSPQKRSVLIRDAPAAKRRKRVKWSTQTWARRRARRRDILERAARLFKEKGFAGTSVQDVADAVGFSKTNFFYHLKSKEQLLYEIFVDTIEFGCHGITKILHNADPPQEKLLALIDFYVRSMTERANVMQVWMRERRHLTRDHQEEIARLERPILALERKFYQDAIEGGAFEPVDVTLVDLAMVGMCLGTTQSPWLPDHVPVSHLSSQLQHLARRALMRSDKD